jgi:TRAP transporter TAXI family solute receptor
MKSIFTYLIIILVAVFFIGSPLRSMAQSQKPEDISIIGGSIAGAWYAMAQGIAESIKKTYPGSRVDVVPGGDAGNVKRIGNMEGTFAFAYLPTAISGFKGEDPFPEPIKDLRVLANVFAAYEQIYILEKSGISSFEEIKTKNYPLKIGANIKSSASEVLFKTALEYYGITYKTLEDRGGKVVFLQTNPTNDLIKGGSLEAHVGTFPVPFPMLSQLNSTHKIRLLSLNDDVIEAMVKKHGGEKGVIPANTYPFQKEDVATVKTYCLLVANKNLPDETAYKIVQSIDKNRDYLGVVHKALKNYTAEFMAIQSMIPTHPGAVKYYKEIGVWK